MPTNKTKKAATKVTSQKSTKKQTPKTTPKKATAKVATKTTPKKATAKVTSQKSTKKQTPKTTQKKTVQPKSAAKNVFAGADDIYLTENNIAVRRIESDTKKRKLVEVMRYYPKTKDNLSKARSVHGTIRKGR